MATLNFITLATGTVGTPLHVTVYDGSGNHLDPASVTWTGLPATVTVTADSDPAAGGFNFDATAAGAANVVAHSGEAMGTLTLNFTAPPLKFTSP